jgi:hypothetical protein
LNNTFSDILLKTANPLVPLNSSKDPNQISNLGDFWNLLGDSSLKI